MAPVLWLAFVLFSTEPARVLGNACKEGEMQVCRDLYSNASIEASAACNQTKAYVHCMAMVGCCVESNASSAWAGLADVCGETDGINPCEAPGSCDDMVDSSPEYGQIVIDEKYATHKVVDSFMSYKSLTSNLVVHMSKLVALTGLNNIQCIAGHVSVVQNDYMQMPSGLGQLKMIGGNLEFQDNSKLSSLEGINGLTHIGGDLKVRGNPRFRTMGMMGLMELRSVGGAVEFSGSPLLNCEEVYRMCDRLDNYPAKGCTCESDLTVAPDSEASLVLASVTFSGASSDLVELLREAVAHALADMLNLAYDAVTEVSVPVPVPTEMPMPPTTSSEDTTTTTTQMPCAAPTVSNQATEGACGWVTQISSGSSCGTRCALGYSPSVEYLTCSNGTLTPENFTCEEEAACVGDPLSKCGLASLRSGSSCTPTCSSGQRPSASRLSCNDGTLSPASVDCYTPSYSWTESNRACDGTYVGYRSVQRGYNQERDCKAKCTAHPRCKAATLRLDTYSDQVGCMLYATCSTYYWSRAYTFKQTRRLRELQSIWASQVMEFELRFFKDGKHPELMSVSEAAGSIKGVLGNHSILMGLEAQLAAEGGLDGVDISLSSKPKPTAETASTSAPMTVDSDPESSTLSPEEMSVTCRKTLISVLLAAISSFLYLL